MTIAITNTSGRIKVINLSHQTYCEALGSCQCQHVPGTRGIRLPSSLTIPTGATVTNLPEAVLALPEVARAVCAGQLSIRHSRPSPTKGAKSETKKPRKSSKKKRQGAS